MCHANRPREHERTAEATAEDETPTEGDRFEESPEREDSNEYENPARTLGRVRALLSL